METRPNSQNPADSSQDPQSVLVQITLFTLVTVGAGGLALYLGLI